MGRGIDISTDLVVRPAALKLCPWLKNRLRGRGAERGEADVVLAIWFYPKAVSFEEEGG